MKKRWWLLLFLLLAIVWFGESRSFYYVASGRCVTLWKTYGGTCYIIPGRYYGLWKPVDNYINAQNTALMVSVFWYTDQPDVILVDTGAEAEIVNHSQKELMVQKKPSMNIYQLRRNDYQIRDDIELVNIRVFEAYATDKHGQAL
ncbi:hypothetical protein [Hymenobacter crusticola]|uniref:Uncharacterized protein n=1 Tax=Hymenobacter crusticola TaxID=1770526 RepID=A0A243W789_9BACT|nr:hypothetical protein [Hymenobacter crusticola]OUJ70292.1 hypothetical protein BXP70_24670 [Hymenobacter crusticola]